MGLILNKISAKPAAAQAGRRPPVAVEVTPEGVLAAALPATGAAPSYAWVALPAGALVPALDAPNLRAPEVLASAMRAALNELSPRTRALTLVLPDILVRVFVLDFDSLPAKADEAIPVLRFRLRKMVPFDVEHAGVSCQVLSQSKDECRVLAAVVPGPILAEYEAAVRAAGYEPGAVLPSSLAALDAVDSMEAVLAANLSGQTITTMIANGEDLLLYRTLDLPPDPGERSREIQRDIAVAAAYYEDKLQAPARRLHYAGNLTRDDFAAWIGGLAHEPEFEIVDLAPRPVSGLTTALGEASIAGVAGALSLRGQQGTAR